MNVNEIQKDLANVRGRTFTGRLMAQVIRNYDYLQEMTAFQVCETFGVSLSKAPDVSKALATVRQLKELEK